MSSSRRRQGEKRNVKQEFEDAIQTSDKELVKFMFANEENLAVAVEYFSDVLEARVDHHGISILQEDGILHYFTEAPPKEVLKAAGNCVHRVIAKGCNAKFSQFLKSLRKMDYFFCQYKYKNVRKQLSHKFTVDEATLDIRTLTFAELEEFTGECNTFNLFKAEDAIAKIQSLPTTLKFPKVKDFRVHADYTKGKTLNQQLQYLANALANLPKICPNATNLSITFFMGILSDDTIENVIARVTALMNDTSNNVHLHVRCQFYQIKTEWNRQLWRFYNYRVQAQRMIRISNTKTLELVRDSFRRPKGLGQGGGYFWYREGEEGNDGQLQRKWFDDVLDENFDYYVE